MSALQSAFRIPQSNNRLFAEWVWLRRWRGESPRAILDPAEFADVESVRSRLAEVARERAQLLAGLTDADLERVVAYVNAKGEEWRYPLGRMMQHVVNHSTYHRGQVVTMLRQLGADAPSTDLLLYDDALAARPS
ncbi:MAG: DinB family protein [Acidobacteria bacterium]|nr:DinB family protein [Acidobacteriota bacterium]